MSIAVLAADADGGPTTYVYDTFTEASDTDMASHTPDTDTGGGGWAQFNSSDIQVLASADQAQPVTAGNRLASLIDPGVEDVAIECAVTYERNGNDGRWGGLCFRHDATTGLYIAPYGLATTVTMRLYSFDASGRTLIVDHTTDVSGGWDGVTAVTRITCVGDVITLTFPNSEATGTYSHTLTGGDATAYGDGSGNTQVGIVHNQGGSGSRWDNFTVTSV